MATLVVLGMFFFTAGLVFDIPQLTKIITKTLPEPARIIYQTVEKEIPVEVPATTDGLKTITVYGLGVFENMSSGERVPINIGMRMGAGRTWIESSGSVLGTDFQASIKNVRECAQKVTNQSTQDYEIYITLKSSAAQVEGTSGGAAITSGVIALLQNRSADNESMISGVIYSDCRVGEVSALNTKARVAMEAGVKNFLVPASECSQMNKSLGIQIVCVKDIYEALPYLVK